MRSSGWAQSALGLPILSYCLSAVASLFAKVLLLLG